MSKKAGQRRASVGESNVKTSQRCERADFTSFGVAPEGKAQQSHFETKWAAYQPWAVCERPDRQFAPVLTDAARAALAEERSHADNGN